MLHKVQNTEIYNTYSDSSITKQFLHIYHYKMYIYKLFSELLKLAEKRKTTRLKVETTRLKECRDDEV